MASPNEAQLQAVAIYEAEYPELVDAVPEVAEDGSLVYPWHGGRLYIFPSGSVGIYPPDANFPTP